MSKTFTPYLVTDSVDDDLQTSKSKCNCMQQN